ncbi:hypothetical protein [Paenibacillus sp. PL2-23]|uniref:hypothetical protein n=1 Tax=Paenibacillus sp. PL2-23 TaxID=2100729 RepID=UPI0030F67384
MKAGMDMLKENIHIAVPTAFHNDESLNAEATLAHIRDLRGRGIRSVLICGSTGEQHRGVVERQEGDGDTSVMCRDV